MTSYLAVFLVLVLTSAALASPSALDLHSRMRLRRDISVSTTSPAISFIGNSGYSKLVEELIENLIKAAQQGKEAVSKFNDGLQDELKKSQENLQQNLEAMKERLNNAIKSISEKFSLSDTAIRECVDLHNGEAELLLDTTMQKTTDCSNQRLNEATEMIGGLSTISERGQEYAALAYEEMQNCTQNSQNFLAVGSCLGTLAVRTEIKGAMFLAQSGLTISRLNLYMATLPAALEICAGSGLVSAGMGTAKIVMEIGSCSASSVFSIFTGNSS